MTDTTEGRPIDYLRGIADSARSAVYLAKEHRAGEAGKHIDAIERLIEGYRSVVAAETAELRARVDELAAAAGGATEPDVDGAGRTYEEYYPAPAPRDLRPGAKAARRMLRGRERINATAAADAEAAHWKRLGINPPEVTP